MSLMQRRRMSSTDLSRPCPIRGKTVKESSLNTSYSIKLGSAKLVDSTRRCPVELSLPAKPVSNFAKRSNAQRHQTKDEG